MNTIETCSHEVEVYTAHACWRGKISIGVQRRISDFLNDTSVSILTLENASAWSWKTNLRLAETPVEIVSILKSNIVFVVNDNQPTRAISNLDRVPKKSLTVTIYAPPFSLTGGVHFSREANWTSVLTLAHLEFIPMTDAKLWLMDDKTHLPVQSGFVAVNRTWIEAVNPVQPKSTPESATIPIIQNAVPVR